MSLHIQNIHINMYSEFLEFNRTIKFNNKYLMYVMFYLQLLNTFTIHVRSLITVEALCFIKSQLRNRCSKYLSSESMHTWTHQIMDCRTLSKVSR